MMNCEESDNMVDAWENGRELPGKFADFRDHVGGCAECSLKYRALVQLIARDDTAMGESPCDTLPEGFLADVMEGLEPKKLKRRKLSFPRYAVAAAAAVALFIAGFGIGARGDFGKGDTVTVRFVLEAREAKSVHLAGDFNNWSTEGYELRRAGSNSAWELRIPLKKGKLYVYNFVVDGEKWIADPTVPARIDDGFGGSGSLLRL